MYYFVMLVICIIYVGKDKVFFGFEVISND